MHGGCHCGKVRYQVDVDLTQPVVECNCSRCVKTGTLLAFVPESAFSLSQGGEHLVDYRFNKKQIAHLFCSGCGVQSFGKGTAPDGSATVAVNVRTLDDVDIETLTKKAFNGKDY